MHQTSAVAFPSEVLEASHDGAVLVDVYAPWCGPCKALAPRLETVAAESPSLTVLKLNGDQAGRLVRSYGVSGYPTLLVFRDGKCVDRNVGAPSLTRLREFVRAHL